MRWTKTLHERIEEKIEFSPTGCWLWTGGLNASGYGVFYVKGSGTLLAHRNVYLHFVGPIPEGQQLDHLCRIRRCVNPEHLEPVTNAENTRRGWDARPRKTHCINDHEYTPENTTYVGGLNGSRQRACLTCQREAKRRYKQRLRDARAAA